LFWLLVGCSELCIADAEEERHPITICGASNLHFKGKLENSMKYSGLMGWGSHQNIWDKIRSGHVKAGRKHYLLAYLPHHITGPSSHGPREKETRF